MSRATAAKPHALGNGLPQVPAGRRELRRLLRPLLMLGSIAIVMVGSLTFWISGGRVVSIDNAYVRVLAKEIVVDRCLRHRVAGGSGAVRDNRSERRCAAAARSAAVRTGGDGAKAISVSIVSDLNAEKVDYKRMMRDVDVKQSQVNLDQVNADRFAGWCKAAASPRRIRQCAVQLATDKQRFGVETSPRCNWPSWAATPGRVPHHATPHGQGETGRERSASLTIP